MLFKPIDYKNIRPHFTGIIKLIILRNESECILLGGIDICMNILLAQTNNCDISTYYYVYK